MAINGTAQVKACDVISLSQLIQAVPHVTCLPCYLTEVSSLLLSFAVSDGTACGSSAGQSLPGWDLHLLPCPAYIAALVSLWADLAQLAVRY